MALLCHPLSIFFCHSCSFCFTLSFSQLLLLNLFFCGFFIQGQLFLTKINEIPQEWKRLWKFPAAGFFPEGSRAVDLFFGAGFLNRFFWVNYAGKYKFEEFLNSGPVRRISRNLKTGYHTTAKQAAKTEKRQRQEISKIKINHRYPFRLYGEK